MFSRVSKGKGTYGDGYSFASRMSLNDIEVWLRQNPGNSDFNNGVIQYYNQKKRIENEQIKSEALRSQNPGMPKTEYEKQQEYWQLYNQGHFSAAQRLYGSPVVDHEKYLRQQEEGKRILEEKQALESALAEFKQLSSQEKERLLSSLKAAEEGRKRAELESSSAAHSEKNKPKPKPNSTDISPYYMSQGSQTLPPAVLASIYRSGLGGDSFQLSPAQFYDLSNPIYDGSIPKGGRRRQSIMERMPEFFNMFDLEDPETMAEIESYFK